jgi:maleylpyruvate isomerase
MIEALRLSTATLCESIATLRPEAFGEPSTLPGWTRGHVATHLARNADGLRVLLLNIRTGTDLGMYSSPAGRDADIEAGAKRPGRVIGADLMHACRALAADIDALSPEHWSGTAVFHTVDGPKAKPATEILEMRIREVEIHHADANVGYDFVSAPLGSLDLILDHAAKRLSGCQPIGLTLTATDLNKTFVVEPSPGSTAEPQNATATAAQITAHLTGRGIPIAGLALAPEWG